MLGEASLLDRQEEEVDNQFWDSGPKTMLGHLHKYDVENSWNCA